MGRCAWNPQTKDRWTLGSKPELERTSGLGEFLSVVTFVDSGTVNDDAWLAEYRVGVGAGLRIFIPQFGQAPIALDFAYPLMKQQFDEEQVFSFTIDLPF